MSVTKIENNNLEVRVDVLFWQPLLQFWPPFSKGYNSQYYYMKQK